MIRHIVLFKMKPFDSTEERIKKLSSIKDDLENLTKIIPEIKLLKVGINMNPNEQFDLSLLSEFESMKDLEIYAKHPDHVAVGKVIREILDARSCVDSEF
ncbi:MAG: Dabb family protein [Paludibacteraceae bacterium]|nr:Dabb family protein [Paludibacteraceae bacterium]